MSTSVWSEPVTIPRRTGVIVIDQRTGHGIGPADVLLAAGLYTLTGFGIAAGFHRIITHRSRRFDRSADLWSLALISFGDSWHVAR